MSDLVERGLMLAERTQLHNHQSLPSEGSRLIFELVFRIEDLEKEQGKSCDIIMKFQEQFTEEELIKLREELENEG